MAQTLKNHKNESKHTFLFAAQPIMKLDWHDESRWLSLFMSFKWVFLCWSTTTHVECWVETCEYNW